jgi:hypothetical protein
VHGLRSLDDLSLLTSAEAASVFVTLPDGTVIQPFAGQGRSEEAPKGPSTPRKAVRGPDPESARRTGNGRR